jgi:mRNA interferase MazF
MRNGLRMATSSIKYGHIYWLKLDPTVGSEMQKARPCLVVSPDSMNKYLRTVIIAPLTSTKHDWPFRTLIEVNGKASAVALDQMRCVDISRVTSEISKARDKDLELVTEKIEAIFGKS